MSTNNLTFNREEFDKNFVGNEATKDELVHSFLIQSTSDINLLNNSYANKNFYDMKMVTHTLKSICDIFIAVEFKKLVVSFEKKIEENQMPNKEELDRLTDAIASLAEDLDTVYKVKKAG